GACDADGHPGHEWTRVVEGLHDPGEAALGGDLRTAQEVPLGNAAVLEDEVGRIRGADAQLVLEPVELEAWVVTLDHEALDGGPALLAVKRRPDDDQLGAVARGDEDLLAVEDVLAGGLVEHGGGADRGG